MSSENLRHEAQITPEAYSIGFLESVGVRWATELYSIYTYATVNYGLTDIIVHGSYGDLTFTNYSDLELTLFFDEKIECIRKNIDRAKRIVNKFLVRADPLQHHSAFILTRNELQSYSESNMPVEAYSPCWSIAGRSIRLKLNWNPAEFRALSARRIDATIKGLRDYQSRFFTQGISLYSIKKLLSNLFMIPVYYYQEKGVYVAKREAIQRFLEEKTMPSLQQSIRRASFLRKNWPCSPGYIRCLRPLVVSGKIPGGKADLLLLSCYRNKEVRQELLNNIIPLMIEGLDQLHEHRKNTDG